MAADKAKPKNGIAGRIIVLLVIVLFGLMILQMGMDTAELAERAPVPTQPASSIDNGPDSAPTDSGPTPTIDFSGPVQELQ